MRLVVGAGGLLGTALRHHVAKTHLSRDFRFLSREDCDISRPDQISAVLDEFDPEWVVNCAALTNVDKAESHPALAHAVNAAGTERLANACKRRGTCLLHVSTDYVFDGSSVESIVEDAPTNPINEYGRSKLAGEEAVKYVGGRWVIMRTSWLFSPWAATFFSSIPRRLLLGESIFAADDQVNRPTYAPDAAMAMIQMMNVDYTGLIHFSSDGTATPLDLAEAFRTAMSNRVHPNARVERCSTASFGARACRPSFNVLNLDRVTSVLGRRPRHWWCGVEEIATMNRSASADETDDQAQ